ncbi:MAG: response regulator [Bdellovibrionota bacterium]
MKASDCRILIVEDDVIFSEALVYELRRKKFQVESVVNGEMAFDLFSKKTFDLVISDIIMPGGGGISLLQKIKMLQPETPVIMLMTGYSEITIEQARSENADAIFCKPLDRTSLLRIISLLLGLENLNVVTNEASPATTIKLFFQEIAHTFESSVFRFVKNGLFLPIVQPFPQVHDIARISFSSSSNTGVHEIIMSSNGVVKWIFFKEKSGAQAEIGVEFMRLTPEDEAKLARLTT